MPDDERFPATRTEGETLDMPEGMGAFSKGQILGERYQILEMLGRGGMGEVWRALDLKLRVEVALKALRPEFFKSERRVELLRQEVRAARDVVSPNVCRIFDLIEIEGRELVSMEYVDGATLLGVLQERGPLDLKEAQDIASQFLAGLEAIHKVGLIHRDIKPENIMITRAGRVVVMDFGLAREEVEGGGSVAGTPAYMAPEQAAGQQLDARADVYAAGVVLAEMVSPEGIRSYESRKSVWEGVRSEPAQVPESPWEPVIARAVARDRERRQNSAHTLIRELEDVTLRVEGAEDLHPYPGLAAFTEEDAEYFFGREAEVEQMWRRLDRPHLLALVGPSGAGKTSFLRAGLVPSAGPGWEILRFTPGSSPFTALGQALAREMAGDVEAMELLARGHDPEALAGVVSRWRQGHDNVLLIVDQFEELFTHCPPDEQQRFAELLGVLPIDADAFVLLSLRDDFLIRCREHETLAPVFNELTALLPPVGGALRRAVVQPATTCGYRFEDDDLVEEILAEVEGERGALPLLAFALARLWENRDREAGLLTTQAYHDVGGVGGALAQHAESTIDRIGTDRIAHIRELFRNLVTAEGTRAVREWGELLSVFEAGQRGRAEEVLRELIDARLLTSYEVREDEREPTRRVEIIHESLLANWPRLVRWQTQDQEGAQVREELRQAARVWDEHGRHDDRLWTGMAYREYQLWRERYPGGLSEIEEAFAAASSALAGRRRRRRRIAAGVGVSILVAVLAVVTGLWRQSVLHQRRAEAQKLIMMGNERMEDYPTAALAYATQSIEMADNEEARLLALKALWQGPTAFVVNDLPTRLADFSPGGEWLVQSHEQMSSISIISSDGRQKTLDHPSQTGSTTCFAIFGGHEDVFLSWGGTSDWGRIGLWSATEGRMLATAKPVENPGMFGLVGGLGAEAEKPRAFFVFAEEGHLPVDSLDTADGHLRLGLLQIDPRSRGGICIPRGSQDWIGVVDGNEVSIVRVVDGGLSDPIPLGGHEGDLVQTCKTDPLGRSLVTWTEQGQMRHWDSTGQRKPTDFNGPSGIHDSRFSSDGSFFWAAAPSEEEGLSDVWIWSVDDFSLSLRYRLDRIEFGSPALDPARRQLAMDGPSGSETRVWSLDSPAGSEPIVIRRRGAYNNYPPAFSPDGKWLATSDSSGLILWPLARPYATVVRDQGLLDFGPEGRLLFIEAEEQISLSYLEDPAPEADRTVIDYGSMMWDIAVSPDGEHCVAAGHDKVVVGRIDGEDQKVLAAGERLGSLNVAFSPDGRYVAAMTGTWDLKAAVYRVWEIATGDEVAVLDLPDHKFSLGASFASDGRLLIGTSKGVVAWDFTTGDHEVLAEINVGILAASENGGRLLVIELGEGGINQIAAGSPVYFDLDSGTNTRLESHGTEPWHVALSRDGRVAVTEGLDGYIRVGPVTGEEPHLILAASDRGVLTIDPLGRWVASSGRLFPMPDLSKPPLHTLPREDLIAKLETLTNIRVVRDEESSTGWTLTHEPFQGWETVPEW
jgi:WD40 repeat protein